MEIETRMNENGKKNFTCVGEFGVALGLRMRQVRREERRVSQERLAEMVTLSMNTINRYERGHRSPTVEEVIRISKALDCDPCWLLTGKRCQVEDEADESDVGS